MVQLVVDRVILFVEVIMFYANKLTFIGLEKKSSIHDVLHLGGPRKLHDQARLHITP